MFCFLTLQHSRTSNKMSTPSIVHCTPAERAAALREMPFNTPKEKAKYFAAVLKEFDRVLYAPKLVEVDKMIKETCQETFQTMLEKIVEEAKKPVSRDEFTKNVAGPFSDMVHSGLLSLDAYRYLYEWMYAGVFVNGFFGGFEAVPDETFEHFTRRFVGEYMITSEQLSMSRGESFAEFMKKTLEVKAAFETLEEGGGV